MDRSRIEAAARLAGFELDPATDITVTGDDPVYPSPFHLGEGASTALALVGQEASRLWQMRGGRPQALALDLRHAAASLNSYRFVSVDGGETSGRPSNPLIAIYPAADRRFVFIHRSMVDAPRMAAELGVAEDATAEEVAAAVRGRPAQEWEDHLASKGLCCVICRTNDEWLAHPQGALLASKPVIEVLKVGDAPPEPLPESPRPLSGVRVLDLTRILAGPTNARTLAEHGADVLHIASPNLPTVDLFEMDTGHGKRQAHIDLNDPAQSDTLRELVRGADVFSQGFQHRSLERRGFGVADLVKLRPGLIYVSENAFGHEGPWQERPGYEQLAQSTTGITITEDPAYPRLSPAAQNDYTTGYFAAIGTMVALRRRALEGGSWSVRVSLSQTSMWYYRLGADLDRDAAPGLGDVSAFTLERDTAWGRLSYLAPPLRMSETPPAWDLPSAPLGSGEPCWQ